MSEAGRAELKRRLREDPAFKSEVKRQIHEARKRRNRGGPREVAHSKNARGEKVVEIRPQCEGRKSNGERCSFKAQFGRRYCGFHG